MSKYAVYNSTYKKVISLEKTWEIAELYCMNLNTLSLKEGLESQYEVIEVIND